MATSYWNGIQGCISPVLQGVDLTAQWAEKTGYKVPITPIREFCGKAINVITLTSIPSMVDESANSVSKIHHVGWSAIQIGLECGGKAASALSALHDLKIIEIGKYIPVCSGVYSLSGVVNSGKEIIDELCPKTKDDVSSSIHTSQESPSYPKLIKSSLNMISSVAEMVGLVVELPFLALIALVCSTVSFIMERFV